VAAEAGDSGAGLVTLSPAAYGVACIRGTWPDIELVDGGPFTVGG
jgi:hypothetical protein